MYIGVMIHAWILYVEEEINVLNSFGVNTFQAELDKITLNTNLIPLLKLVNIDMPLGIFPALWT